MLYLIPLLTASPSGDPAVASMEVYKACVMEQVDRFASLEEPAETIARAAETACSDQLAEMHRKSIAGLPSGARETMADLLTGYERDVRDRAVLRVLEARLKAGG